MTFRRVPTPTAPLLINDLGRHNRPLLPEIESRIRTVLASGWYILGEQVAGFEAAFAAYCGAAHCIGVGNGTDALEIALRALGIGPGDQVASVANAGGYGTAAIRCAGAEPLFVDVAADSMLMDAAALPGRITPRTKAILVTHLYGRMADMPALVAIGNAAGIPVVEDCAQAHGARLDGRAAGSWADIGCFSFYPTKNLGALGDGGALVTSNADLAGRARRLRQYGWTRKYETGAEQGRNSRLDEIQAAVLAVKLPRLDGWNRRRREIAALYAQVLQGSGADAPSPGGEEDARHLYVIRTPLRDRVRAALAAQGIVAELHYPIADHHQLSAAGQPWSREELPTTDRCCREVLTLPCFPEMSDEEARLVAEAVRSALAGRDAR